MRVPHLCLIYQILWNISPDSLSQCWNCHLCFRPQWKFTFPLRQNKDLFCSAAALFWLVNQKKYPIFHQTHSNSCCSSPLIKGETQRFYFPSVQLTTKWPKNHYAINLMITIIALWSIHCCDLLNMSNPTECWKTLVSFTNHSNYQLAGLVPPPIPPERLVTRSNFIE